MFKTLMVGLLFVAGSLIIIESAQAFGGRRRTAQMYVTPAPTSQTVVAPGVAAGAVGAVPVATPQYQVQQYQTPRYQSPAGNNYYYPSRQPQDASYAYPKADARRYNFQYNHN